MRIFVNFNFTDCVKNYSEFLLVVVKNFLSRSLFEENGKDEDAILILILISCKKKSNSDLVLILIYVILISKFFFFV